MRIALYQARTGIDPAANADDVAGAVREAAAGGAAMLFTPEMSGLLDQDRARASRHLRTDEDDPLLAAVREAAAEAGIWVHLGSLALLGGEGGRLVNRGFVIDPGGTILARYDKIHLFDVDLATGESWRESAAYSPGGSAVIADTALGPLGLSICYDLRFASLYAALSEAGAAVLSIPAAFTVPTGQAHWHVLLRARAIESQCFVVAAAQCGAHEDGRRTYGHSLVVGPWGEVLLDMGAAERAVGYAEIDLAAIDEVRGRLPVLRHRRAFALPEPAR
ncbi:carbon-nitrogen hydrolase family protein [Allosphingosinicella sp.]|jgi:predicted amidohydrolase|uniref:carbon-nitrogen hydrolase family protein n=1 Tax=Allosphingosinicella sp. TaxID=2823234 RepID=UPI002EE194B9